MKYLPIIFLLFASCVGQNNDFSYNIKPLRIEIDSLANFRSIGDNVFEFDDKEYLYRWNRDNNSVDIFSINNKQMSKRIDIPFSFDGYYPIVMDKLYVIEYEKNIIHLINDQDEILKSFDFNALISNDTLKYITYSSSGKMLNIIDDKVIINIVANTIVPKYYKYPTMGILNIKKNQLDKFAYFPEFMQDGNIWKSFYPYYCINNKNEIIVTFATSPEIFIYNEDGELIETKNIKSSYIDNFKPIPTENTYQKSTSIEYETTRSRYSLVIYDKYRDLYYRFAVHPQESVNDDGSVNQYNSNKWSIMVLNSDFELIKEILMEKNKYIIHSAVLTKEGLLIQKNKSNSPDYNYLDYSLIKIKVN